MPDAPLSRRTLEIRSRGLFAAEPENLAEPDSRAWLRSLSLRRSAPDALLAAARDGDAATFAIELKQELTSRGPQAKKHRRRQLAALRACWVFAGTTPLAMDDSRHELTDECPLTQCLFADDLNSDELSGHVETVLASFDDRPPGEQSLLAAWWLLAIRANELEPETLLDLWRWALDQSRTRVADAAEGESSLRALPSLEIETLSATISHFCAGAMRRAKTALSDISAAILAATESDGSPHAAGLELLVPSLASATRVRQFLELTGDSEQPLRAAKRLSRVLLRAVHFVAGDRMLLGSTSAATAWNVLMRAAEFADEETRATLWRTRKRWSRVAAPRGRPAKYWKRHRLLPPMHQSDPAGWAVLRSDWSHRAATCAVRLAGERMRLELAVDGAAVLGGDWPFELRANAAALALAGNWTCVCWFTDKDAILAEFQLDTPAAKLIRQVFLPVRDSWLLLTDSVRVKPVQIEPDPSTARPVSTSSPEWHYARALPLASGWETQQDAATRELALVRGEHRVRVLPVTAPQVKVQRSRETTRPTASGLATDIHTADANFYLATVLDWSSDRRDAGADWQTLTVAEDGRFTPASEATGVRWRLAEDQWVLYHSFLKPHFPRTCMGIHTLSETVLSQVKKRGELSTLVEVDGELTTG